MTPDSIQDSGRRGQSSFRIIPLVDAKEGCRRIAENIEQLAQNASVILSLNEDLIDRRVAWILILHAIDETGKLIKTMREAEVAELSQSDKVTIRGFTNHTDKGMEAGSAGILALEWFEGLFREMGSTYEADGFDVLNYRVHLETLRGDFSRERMRALYVDYRDDKWIPPNCADEGHMYLDAWTLLTIAFVVRVNLDAGKSLTDVNEVFRKLHASSRLLKAEWEKSRSRADSRRPT